MSNAQNCLGKMNVRVLSLGVIVVQIFTISCHKQQSTAPGTIDAGDEKMAASKIADGDQLYAAREDMMRARVAVATFRQAVTADYGNYEAAWKLSRACFYVGDHTDNDNEAEDMFRTGIEAGKAAVKLKGDGPEGHFWLGANYGGNAQRSTLASLATVPDIRTEMETVIKLDEKYQ